ncbi:hypothetical protein HW555_010739 [Spodoptera exigua]|uniref:MADF domain-containing protein n=1 Tax=Spodoptera exigua TaxID=7107 RepID=A0A835G9W4_SPOEX|nr:hypothetical protein HW555_010739 [Spodoptera exigua]
MSTWGIVGIQLDARFLDTLYIMEDCPKTLNIEKFNDYLVSAWLDNEYYRGKWDFWGDIYRTNNPVEGSNAKLNRTYSGKLNLISFLNVIKNDAVLSLARQGKPRRADDIAHDKYISDSVTAMLNGTISLGHCLEKISPFDKTAKTAAWREICIILKEDFEEMDQKDRQLFGSSVMKRWTQLRDTWRKSLDENKETKKSGSGTKSKPYKYNQEMSFLKPIIKPGETYDNNPNTRDEAQRENADQQENQKEKHLESSSKKKRMDSGSVLDDKMMKLVDHQLNTIGSDDRNMNFFNLRHTSMVQHGKKYSKRPAFAVAGNIVGSCKFIDNINSALCRVVKRYNRRLSLVSAFWIHLIIMIIFHVRITSNFRSLADMICFVVTARKKVFIVRRSIIFFQ